MDDDDRSREQRAKKATYNAAYYAKTRERIAARKVEYGADYYAKNRARITAYNAAYYDKNKERKATYAGRPEAQKASYRSSGSASPARRTPASGATSEETP